jgi:hypothetical protein
MAKPLHSRAVRMVSRVVAGLFPRTVMLPMKKYISFTMKECCFLILRWLG